MIKLSTLKPRVALLGNTRTQTNAVERIRGRRLQEIRAYVLRSNPLCVMCAASGRIAAATQVDHIVALVNGGKDTDENRQGLCDDCHKLKTIVDLAHSRR